MGHIKGFLLLLLTVLLVALGAMIALHHASQGYHRGHVIMAITPPDQLVAQLTDAAKRASTVQKSIADVSAAELPAGEVTPAQTAALAPQGSLPGAKPQG